MQTSPDRRRRTLLCVCTCTEQQHKLIQQHAPNGTEKCLPPVYHVYFQAYRSYICIDTFITMHGRTAFWDVVLDVALPVPKGEGVAVGDFVDGDGIVVDARRGRVDAGEAGRSQAGEVAAGGPVIVERVVGRVAGALATVTRIVV